MGRSYEVWESSGRSYWVRMPPRSPALPVMQVDEPSSWYPVGARANKPSSRCAVGGLVYAILGASNAAGGNSRFAALREPVIALSDAEHDPSRLCIGQMLRDTAYFLRAVPPMCDVVK